MTRKRQRYCAKARVATVLTTGHVAQRVYERFPLPTSLDSYGTQCGFICITHASIILSKTGFAKLVDE